MQKESRGADAATPVVVIMAGGAGTRFWPASTRLLPKQFLSLLGEQSLLQESYSRARCLTDPERIIVFTNVDYAAVAGDQLPELELRNIVAEPARRDTAAAVCLAALLVQQRYGDAVMVILTADHLIEPVEEFARVIASACEAAARDAVLYTIGVPPDHPATAYGYLEVGGTLLDDDGVTHRKVRSFREKPDRNTADRYLAVGGYLWNSGMFIWRTSVVLAAYAEHLPGHVAVLTPAVEALGEAAQEAALAEAFPRLPSVSVDYGIMEKVDNVRVVEATFIWNDLGSWPALSEFLRVMRPATATGVALPSTTGPPTWSSARTRTNWLPWWASAIWLWFGRGSGPSWSRGNGWRRSRIWCAC